MSKWWLNATSRKPTTGTRWPTTIFPVAQTWMHIPRPLFTQSHRHGWTYQGLYLPSHTDTAGHTKAFIYPVTQTRLDIPRPLFTQSRTTEGKTLKILRTVMHFWPLGMCESSGPELLNTPGLRIEGGGGYWIGARPPRLLILAGVDFFFRRSREFLPI